jgi:hypothetical protein
MTALTETERRPEFFIGAPARRAVRAMLRALVKSSSHNFIAAECAQDVREDARVAFDTEYNSGHQR